MASIAIISANTKTQADWTADKVAELGIKSIRIFAAPFHMVRAYLTFLKSLIDKLSAPIIMIPEPTDLAPSALIPVTGTNSWGLIAKEIERIVAYQAQGDVATLRELEEYLNWLYNH